MSSYENSPRNQSDCNSQELKSDAHSGDTFSTSAVTIMSTEQYRTFRASLLAKEKLRMEGCNNVTRSGVCRPQKRYIMTNTSGPLPISFSAVNEREKKAEYLGRSYLAMRR